MSIGVKFNNPLNVRPTPAELAAGRSNWQGVAAIEQTMAGPFLRFDTPAKGWRCAAGTVIAHFDRWGHNTIATLIGGSGRYGTPDYRPGWAPPQDRNDVAAYIARVVGATGFAADAVLNFHAYAHLKPVLVAMAEVEQGQSPYTWWNDAQIDWGLAQFGVLAPAKPIAKGPIVAGAATAATAAGQVLTQGAPPIASPAPPMLPADLAPVQSALQTLAPYFKWAGIALLVLMAGAALWYWAREWRKRRLGLA
jgi:hypothetical protein